jgi:plastocyanin
MKPKVPTAALCVAVAAVAVAGCGSSSSKKSTAGNNQPPASTAPNPGGGTTNANKSPSGGGKKSGAGKSTNLQLAADSSGQLKFDKTTLNAKAGNVTITMDNPSGVPHAIAVEGNGIDKKGQTVQMNGKSMVTASLKPGKYTFYCPVDGHRQAGMQGTLTVK